MRQAVLAAAPGADALLMAAAVADYRPVAAAAHKIKKDGETLRLELARTADILSEVALLKGRSGRPRAVVGFAAETRDLLANARDKLARKRLDLIVANDVAAAGAGFEVDTNRVTLLDPSGATEELPLMSKAEVAERIMDRLVGLLPPP
jgi:phosphopantothenoylcysteine decarboxylase/phosphopantothenate--cysteine ligase